MAKTIVVCGFGPGISSAVARKFGQEGFSVALVARNAERLAAGVKALEAAGVQAAAFPTDLGDPASVRAMIESVRARFGAITVVQWNAFSMVAGDLLTADAAAIRQVFDVPVTGLLSAVQASLPDLRKQSDSAVLVTNGALGYFDPPLDTVAVHLNAMGIAVGNAAKHKLVGLLAAKLKPENVYVGEVVVLAPVKGTFGDDGSAKLEAATVAAKFWEIYRARETVTAQVG
jgi:NAD(P)-dependent dehydrogenase (short-subunit alcohol dehydrogenase family)